MSHHREDDISHAGLGLALGVCLALAILIGGALLVLAW